MIQLRINAEIIAGPEIGALQAAALKPGALQVALIKYGIGQVSFCKIGFLQGAVGKAGFFVLFMVKNGIIQQAPGKMKLEQEIAAFTEMDTAQFAARKFYVLQAGAGHGGQHQVAICKLTIGKNKGRQVGIRKIAACKTAGFEVAGGGEGIRTDFGKQLVGYILHR